MAELTLTAPDVALIWKVSKNTNKPQIKVSLQEINYDEGNVGAKTASSPIEAEICEESSDGTPASVLVYERQMRKAQHAKKVGMAVNSKDLQVVYVDQYIVVVNKPPGLLTVPGINVNPSLLDLVYQQYGNGVGDPQTMIVHRLDMGTTLIAVSLSFHLTTIASNAAIFRFF